MKGLLAVATAAALVAAPAAAHVVTLTYTGTNDATTATLVLTTSNAHNGLGGFDILSVTGNVSGDAVTTIAPVNPPGFSTDNTFYERDPVFSTGGVGFFSATTTYNLWGTGPGCLYAVRDDQCGRELLAAEHRHPGDQRYGSRARGLGADDRRLRHDRGRDASPPGRNGRLTLT